MHRIHTYLIWGAFVCCFSISSLFAQQSLLHTEPILWVPNDTIHLTHTFIAPFSEKIFTSSGEVISSNAYQLDHLAGWLIPTTPLQSDSAYQISYRYFVNPLKNRIALRQLSIKTDSTGEEIYTDIWIQPAGSENETFFWETSQIRKTGSLSRGLTMGNSRGLSVNSGLNLQLEGELSDGIKVIGTITDQNIPIQPDGTTQQINDLDKIFVQLIKDRYSFTIGDFEISSQGTRFGNFYRNVQGLRFDYKADKTRASVSAAVAKGKFHTNSFIGKEGISGPYQLTGKNGERFFFVLAGSERVYLNGKLMRRGELEDYIIDYNIASVSFTPRHVITSVTRIVIDFEYNDQNFNRSLMVAQVEQKLAKDKLDIRLSYARDADNPNAPFNDAQAFNEVRAELAAIGDEDSLATSSGVNLAGFSKAEGQVRYIRRDTLIDSLNYERYIFATDSSAVYKISFSYVGPNRGFYRRDNRGINRVVYEWVPPGIDGSARADYAPVRKWVLPRLLQVLNAGVDFQLTDKIKLYSETAVSSEDLNRLSSLDDQDNIDLANRTGIVFEQLKLGDSLDISVDLSHQYVGKSYTNVDRVYQAEYNRKWNLDNQPERRNERIGLAKIRLNYKNKLEWQAETGYRNVGQGRTAYRQVYSLISRWPKWIQGNYTFTQIKNKNDKRGFSSEWIRHEGDIFQLFGPFKLGVELWAEDREQKLSSAIGSGSFSFFDLKPYLRTFNSRKFQLDASVNYRKEKAFAGRESLDKSRAYTYYTRWGYKPSPQFQLQHTFSYRDFQLLDTIFAAEGLSDTRLVQTNLQLRYVSKKRTISTNLLYDVSSEGVAKRDVMFVEVNPGQGQYEYIEDINGNGVQDLDEFQLSTNFLAANYVRVLIPSRELFPTTKLNLNGNLRINFKGVIEKSSNKFSELIRNTRLMTQVKVSQSKERSTGLGTYFIDLSDIFADSTLLNANYHFRQDVIFFPNSPIGELRFSFVNNQSKLFLSTGNELRSLQYWSFKQRLNLGSSKSIEHELRVGQKQSKAELFSSRNFNLRFIETQPQLNLQLSRRFRLSTGYTYKFKKNMGVDQEIDARVQIHKFIGESRWNLNERNSLRTRIELVQISQKGESNFSGQYELREGLQPGFNAIWQLFASYFLLSNVELSLTYDGRASVKNPTIHTGRMQIRAFF